MSVRSEQELVSLSKNGDHKAYRQLVEQTMKQAYNLAYRYVGNHDDAEDVAQEAFVRAYRSLKQFRGDAGFSTWLYRIVTNVALNKVKQVQRLTKHEQPMNESVEIAISAEHTATKHADTSSHVERALHELPTLQRAVVILRHLNGLSTKQVSDILHCSEGTVKTHLHRGISKLRISLKFLENE